MDDLESTDLSYAFQPTRNLAHGWEALKRQPIGLLLGAFLMTITDGGGGGSGGSNSGSGTREPLWDSNQWGQNHIQAASDWGQGLLGQADMGGAEMAVVAMIAGCVLGCLLLVALFRCWLEPGYIRLQREVLADGAGKIGTLFSGTDAFVRMLLWKLLSFVIGLGTAVVSLLPGGAVAGVGWFVLDDQTFLWVGVVLGALLLLPAAFYVGIGLSLGAHAVSLDDLGAMDALERSWGLARGNRLTLFVFYLVTAIVWFLGVCLCCVGIVGTRVMRDVATTEGYLLATRRDEAEAYVLLQDPVGT